MGRDTTSSEVGLTGCHTMDDGIRTGQFSVPTYMTRAHTGRIKQGLQKAQRLKVADHTGLEIARIGQRATTCRKEQGGFHPMPALYLVTL